jgi:hypothetical protein
LTAFTAKRRRDYPEAEFEAGIGAE